MGKYNKYYKIVDVDTVIGRCIGCEARELCGKLSRFECGATYYQHYKFDIKLERIEKLNKIKTKLIIFIYKRKY